jgi:hypothetical protein
MNKREHWLKVRLSDDERSKLQSYADSKGWTMSQVVREYIRKLPKSDVNYVLSYSSGFR